MTDDEVLFENKSDSVLNKLRQVFEEEYNKIEREKLSGIPPRPLQLNRMQYDAVRNIARVLGIHL